MFVMLLTGGWALEQMNVQFFPNFELDFVTVRVVWTGASAEDIEDGITVPLEQRLKNVDNLHRLTSTSSLGVSAITLEFKDGTDPLMAVEQVRRLVDEFRNLPQEAERPVVTQIVRYEPVAHLLVTGAGAEELREQVRRFETELLARGIDKVDIRGLAEQEIAIEIDSATLDDLRLSLDEVMNGSDLSLESRYKTSPWSLFTIVEARKFGAEPDYVAQGRSHFSAAGN